MASTITDPAGPQVPPWRASGYRYYPYRLYLQQRFGRRVQKVSVDGGMTCPNVDGTVAVGGCVFCDNRSFSPSRRLPRQSISSQIEEGIRRMASRYGCEHFLAYFQPATNTYARIERLDHDVRAGTVASPSGRTGDWHAARLCAGRGTRLDRVSGGADLCVAGVRHANHARPVAGLDEPRAPSPRVCRRDGSQPRPWL